MIECKMCDKEFLKINMSHIKTHNMTQKEYDDYSDVNAVEPEVTVETIWDSVDTNSIEYKMKVARLGKNIKELTRKGNIKVQEGRLCPQCHLKIYEPTAYVLLRSRAEIQGRLLLSPQFIMHRPCAIAVADFRDGMAAVFFP